jgi:hypothetical protein
VWFGWGQADARSWLVIPLAVGTVLGALLAVAGVVVAKRSAGPLPPAPSTVTGAGAGLCLLAFGFATLLAGRHAPSPPDWSGYRL